MSVFRFSISLAVDLDIIMSEDPNPDSFLDAPRQWDQALSSFHHLMPDLLSILCTFSGLVVSSPNGCSSITKFQTYRIWTLLGYFHWDPFLLYEPIVLVTLELCIWYDQCHEEVGGSSPLISSPALIAANFLSFPTLNVAAALWCPSAIMLQELT